MSAKARKTKPAYVEIFEMSDPDSWSGTDTLKSRSAMSAAGRDSLSRAVVRTFIRRLTPCRPAKRISLATRPFPTRIHTSISSAGMRRTPQVPFDLSWISSTLQAHASSATDRAEALRSDHL